MTDWDVIGTANGPVEVHGSRACFGQFCCIHNPSTHPLNEAPMRWRGDRGLMERICSHDIGHPDPDDLAHKQRDYGELRAYIDSVHGCDGCCSYHGRHRAAEE